MFEVTSLFRFRRFGALVPKEFTEVAGASMRAKATVERVRTASQEADEIMDKCLAMKSRLAVLEKECLQLSDRLAVMEEERTKLSVAASEVANADDDRASRVAGIAGGTEADTFLVDPLRVPRVHKSRVAGSVSQLDAMTKSGVKVPIGQSNNVSIIGTIMEAPLYGFIGGSLASSMRAGPTAVDELTTQSADVVPRHSPRSGATAAAKRGLATTSESIAVMQLTIQQLGTRPMGYPAPARPFMNTFIVQCRGSRYSRLALTQGQRVAIINGHYGVHAVFQLDTTQWQLNPVVDVGPSGFIGIL